MKGFRVKFDTTPILRDLKKKAVEEQTNRLIAYAQKELRKMFETHEFHNRTLNLEDSYVWAVFYNGKRKSYGFVGNKLAHEKSILHEWGDPSTQEEVDGRKEAQVFVGNYTSNVSGWEVVWAACAPYGAYLEGGFTTPQGRFMQFDVITQRFDAIKSELEPYAKVSFEIKYPV